MYPNYVYRPQRVKGKEATANGKGKAHGAEEPETDSEGLAFVMPVPLFRSAWDVVPFLHQPLPRHIADDPHLDGVHAIDAFLALPSSPSMVPVTVPCTCSPTQIPTQLQWVKKLSQCLAVLERLTWHKSNKLCNNLKIIYVILGHLGFHISLNARDLK
jgi:hypothetical protein